MHGRAENGRLGPSIARRTLANLFRRARGRVHRRRGIQPLLRGGHADQRQRIPYDRRPDQRTRRPTTAWTTAGSAKVEGINGSDDYPLVLEFAVDFQGEYFGQSSNIYLELSYDDGTGNGQAPRTGMTTEDANLWDGDRGPWTDGTEHRVLAYGSFAGIQGSRPIPPARKTQPCISDGLRWHYLYLSEDLDGAFFSLWKRQDGGTSIFRLTVRTDTVDVEVDNMGAWPDHNTPHRLVRSYRGPFNRLSVTVGAAHSYMHQVDAVSLQDGLVVPAGACCIRNGGETGFCQNHRPEPLRADSRRILSG